MKRYFFYIRYDKNETDALTNETLSLIATELEQKLNLNLEINFKIGHFWSLIHVRFPLWETRHYAGRVQLRHSTVVY